MDVLQHAPAIELLADRDARQAGPEPQLLDVEIVVGRVHQVEISDSGAAPLVYWRGSYLPLEGA